MHNEKITPRPPKNEYRSTTNGIDDRTIEYHKQKNKTHIYKTKHKLKQAEAGGGKEAAAVDEIVDLLKNWMIFNLLLELLANEKLMLGQCQDLGVLYVFTSSDLIVFLLQVDLMKIDHGMLHRDCFLAILNKLLGFDNLFAGKL